MGKFMGVEVTALILFLCVINHDFLFYFLLLATSREWYRFFTALILSMISALPVGASDLGALLDHASAMMRPCPPFQYPCTITSFKDTHHSLLAAQVDVTNVELLPAGANLFKAAAPTHSLNTKNGTLHQSVLFTMKSRGA